MKRITLMMLVTISLLSSCTKSSIPTDTVDEAALSAVMSSRNYRELKINYALLKPAEKLELWNRHIEYFIQTHDLTSDQSAFVNEFKNQWLIKNIFEESSTTLNNFTLALPQIKYKAQLLLGIPDAFSLLMDLPSDKGYYGYHPVLTNSAVSINSIKSTGVKPLEDSNDCSCSQTDPYCNVGSCRDNGCSTSSLGCGTLFLFKCNGVCQFF